MTSVHDQVRVALAAGSTRRTRGPDVTDPGGPAGYRGRTFNRYRPGNAVRRCPPSDAGPAAGSVQEVANADYTAVGQTHALLLTPA